jgi:hypothetical protein
MLSWLVINSMRVDGVQFNTVRAESSNVWRKEAFGTLKADYKKVDSAIADIGVLGAH